MFGFDTSVEFEPVIPTISSDDESGDEDYFDDLTIPMSLERFVETVVSSGKSWEATYDAMTQYHSKLISKGKELTKHAWENEVKIIKLQAKMRDQVSSRDRLVQALHYLERKVFLLRWNSFKCKKAVNKKTAQKELLQGIADKSLLENQKMLAEVQRLRRMLAIKLRGKT